MFGLKGWQKYLVVLALAALVVFGLARLYYRLTDDIRIANMTYEMPYRKEWDIPPLSPMDMERINAILNQPFHYIGKGAQSYAFASQDEKYVLKFFKFKHVKPSWFVEMLPDVGSIKEYKQAQQQRRKKKLDSMFEGYRLAYEVHKDPSGIIYIHLNPTDTLHKTVVLKDKIGLSHTIDLDKFVFILQEKASTTRAVMKELLNAGRVDEAKQKIAQIFALYLTEYKKGIYDRDHGVMHNTGFVGDKPIHLDVGKLTDEPAMKEPESSDPDLEKIAGKFHTWLHANYPAYADEIDREMEIQLSAIFGKPWTFQPGSKGSSSPSHSGLQ